MTAARQLRVAVVGCGWYAQNHLQAWKALAARGADLVGLADIDPVKAQAASERFEAPAFDSLTALLDATQPDLVDIVTTVETHCDLVKLAAERGIGVVVQKPMAQTWAECLDMAEAVKTHNVFFAVHENFRFQAAILRLRTLLANGVIGTPSFGRISFRTAFDTTALQPHLLAQKRFILMDIGVHVLDLARVLIGEVQTVSCETQRRRPELVGEDTATMLLRHRTGAVSVVECSFSAHRIVDAFPETMIDLEGDLGCITLRESGAICVKSRGITWHENASPPPLEWTERPFHIAQESVLTFNRHILDAWQSATVPETGLMSSLSTFALVEAAYRAAEIGAAVVPDASNAQASGRA